MRQQINATLEAILITGDTSFAVRELAQDSHLRIVSKPVHAEELLRVVRQLIAAWRPTYAEPTGDDVSLVH